MDNVVSLDLGLTVRDFDGGFDVTDGTQKAELDINAAVPLLYGAVSVALPFTGLSVGGHINILGINETSLSDTRASLKWESPLGLGVEAGLRRMELKHDDDEEEQKKGDGDDGAADEEQEDAIQSLHELDPLNAHDMTVEAVVTKLSFLMGKGLRGDALKQQFERNLRGEMTPLAEVAAKVVKLQKRHHL